MKVSTQVPAAPLGLDRAAFRDSVIQHLAHTRVRDQYRASAIDVMHAVGRAAHDRLADRWLECSKQQWDAGKKRVYYLSMEYLPGRLLRDGLANLGMLEEARAGLVEIGIDLDEVLEVEPDPGLGNGGLGRLASCFLDSMATLGIAGTGYGIRYDYGIFRQAITKGEQHEEPDSWLEHGTPFGIRRTETHYRVKFGGRVQPRAEKSGDKSEGGGRTFYEWVDTQDVIAEAHDIAVPGYRNDVVNTLRLWWARPVVAFDLARFNAGDHQGSVTQRNIAEHITRVLYPNDSGPTGKELRLRQEYFFVSASLQDAIQRHIARWGTLDDFSDRNVFQLNDTHPALAVAEMMRILLDEHRFTWERSWSLTKRSFAYTNHTLLPEALEVWPVHMLDKLLPRQLDIIREIDRRLGIETAALYPGDDERQAKMAIVERGPQPNVRMANLSIAGSFSVNGVSALHSQLLRERMFPELDAFFPGRFRNETNGVTPRRWIEQCNPALASLLTETVGPGWVTNLAVLRGLEAHADDAAFLERLWKIKQENKRKLVHHLAREVGVALPAERLFDVQIKRIHEYKRQLLNVLHVVHRYLRIKAGETPRVPRTVLFGGKAASAYEKAKRIIHLAGSVASVVNDDVEARAHLAVMFVPNYRVSLAEKLIPAADLSEQISTSGYEASGTGNMKFSMNGALTIGTLDGANVEIREAVGAENFFLFGLTAEEVLAKSASGYAPRDVYTSSPALKAVIDAILSGVFSPDEPGRFRPLIEPLLEHDRYFVFEDFDAYVASQDQVDALYATPAKWTRMALLNIARMGRFSSDETIRGYARDIWGVPL
ncbi:MAG: glycogen/starch/alpha-glucan phosphorylase [Deltaproteobacteria bacterium]|nr:glycogen/starch/alpha-glucan phosphorylase [Deltaproteobacteria bacterium]